jgi:hypothetical protein
MGKKRKDREPLLTVGVGKKGVGKSYQMTRIIKAYVKGGINGMKPRKVLIMDINNEFSDFPLIRPTEQAPTWEKVISQFSRQPTIEARRINLIKADGDVISFSEFEELLKIVLKNFYGGLLHVEDIAQIISPNMKKDIIGAMCTNRHRDCDVYMHFQDIARAATPAIMANMNQMRLHPTNDSIDKHHEKFGGRFQMFKIAEIMVRQKYNEHLIKIEKERDPRTYFDFFVYVNCDKSKVYGTFSKKDFQNAIEDYLNDNPKIIQKMVDKKNRKGEKEYKTYSQAYDAIEQELIRNYYGNPK